MRAAVSHLFGVHPWDYEQLTFSEFRAYVAQAEAHLKEAQRARQAAR